MDKEKRPKTAPLEDDNYAKLRALSNKTGMKIGAMVNQAVAAWIKAQKAGVRV